MKKLALILSAILLLKMKTLCLPVISLPRRVRSLPPKVLWHRIHGPARNAERQAWTMLSVLNAAQRARRKVQPDSKEMVSHRLRKLSVLMWRR